jgi:hypothetical protein
MIGNYGSPVHFLLPNVGILYGLYSFPNLRHTTLQQNGLLLDGAKPLRGS